MNERPFSLAINRLRAAGLRPTRQRLALARLLFDRGDRHVTAEMLHREAARAGIRLSLATVYNSLHQFTQAGLLRQVVIDSGRSYFDTNTNDHHHFLHEPSGELHDIPAGAIELAAMPAVPPGTRIAGVHVIVRLSGKVDKK